MVVVKGGKFRVVAKNNNASGSHSIKYNFNLSNSTIPNNNMGAGIVYGQKPGLWNSDDENFLLFPVGSNGQITWGVDSFLSMPAQSVMQFEIDVRPGGRVSFFSNSNNVIWSYSSIGGFAEAFEAGSGDSGGETPIVPADPPVSYANGDARDGFSGPFFIMNEPGHYDMSWRAGSGANIKADRLMGGDGSLSQAGTMGNEFYGRTSQGATSFNLKVYGLVAYYSPAGTINDNFSIGWGLVFPGSVGPDGFKVAQGYIDELNQYIEC